MSEPALLEMENIGKYYGNIIALTGVTTSVNAGEVTCVLGDNGAGKSTFIKIIAGAHQQSEGILKVEGDEVLFDSPRWFRSCRCGATSSSAPSRRRGGGRSGVWTR